MTNTGADFAPKMVGYTGQQPFRFWCQTVLPLVYDDSLSYYELLCKVVSYINNLISDTSTLETNVTGLFEAYVRLEEYVNNYFDSTDFQQLVNDKLDEMAEDGTLLDLVSEALQNIKMGENNLSDTLKLKVIKDYVTPEMYGAKGDGTTDDTLAMNAALRSGKCVRGIGNYRITSTIFLTNEYISNAGSTIKLDFTGAVGVVIGGSMLEYDNTQYNFDVDITIDGNNKAFTTACVALNAIKRSNIKLRGFNILNTFYKDVYGNNGSNYENYVDINAIGTEQYGSICAKLQSTDNNYNQIISRDFETCILFNTSSTQNINCIHAWLSSARLWENSKVIAVENVSDDTIMPRLVFNFMYQDTMRYGFYVNRIEAYGQFWFSAVNSGIVSAEVRSQYPIVEFYGANIDNPSYIKSGFHEFFSARLRINDERALIFNGEINPPRTGYMYNDANAIPMGNVTVSLSANAANAPSADQEVTLIQNCSLRRLIQMVVMPSNVLYVRKKGTWETTWGRWIQIDKPDYSGSVLTSTHTIGGINRCVERSGVVQFDLTLTIASATVNTTIATLPDGYRPMNSYQFVCFGLSGNKFLEVQTNGNITLNGTSITESTVLRIHSTHLTA